MPEHVDDGTGGTIDDPGSPGRDASGFIIIDPAARNSGGSGSGDNSGDDTGGSTRRRRGRATNGTGKATSSDTASLSGIDIKDILLNIHMMLSMWSGIPELALEDAEAKRLETAIKKVQRHYPVNISQKHVDMSYLIYTVGMIYGTRAVAIYAGRKTSPTKPDQSDNVVNFDLGIAG